MHWRIVRNCSRLLQSSWSRPAVGAPGNFASGNRFQACFCSDVVCDKNGSSSSEVQSPTSVAGTARRWRQIFEKEGVPEPFESIDHIIAHVLGITRITDLVDYDEKQLSKKQLETLEMLCECRLSRMPVQYIIGEWDFRDITLKLEPPIFIPRPETEILVDFLLKRIATSNFKSPRVLEIGCGSGAICLSVLHSNKDVNVVAIDINPHACELTIRNAQKLQLEDRLSILNAALQESGTIDIKKEYSLKQPVDFNQDKFDFIVSNPPYIPTKTIFKLQPEVNIYEDIKALDGGNDGLKLIEPILKYASKALNSGGMLILEVDSNHPERIKYLTEKYYSKELKFEHVHKDFCNKDRIIEISKTDNK